MGDSGQRGAIRHLTKGTWPHVRGKVHSCRSCKLMRLCDYVKFPGGNETSDRRVILDNHAHKRCDKGKLGIINARGSSPCRM